MVHKDGKILGKLERERERERERGQKDRGEKFFSGLSIGLQEKNNRGTIGGPLFYARLHYYNQI